MMMTYQGVVRTGKPVLYFSSSRYLKRDNRNIHCRGTRLLPYYFDAVKVLVPFLLYRKLLSCKVKNAPRGCTLRRIRQMSQATAAGAFFVLLERKDDGDDNRLCRSYHISKC